MTTTELVATLHCGRCSTKQPLAQFVAKSTTAKRRSVLTCLTCRNDLAKGKRVLSQLDKMPIVSTSLRTFHNLLLSFIQWLGKHHDLVDVLFVNSCRGCWWCRNCPHNFIRVMVQKWITWIFSKSSRPWHPTVGQRCVSSSLYAAGKKTQNWGRA